MRKIRHQSEQLLYSVDGVNTNKLFAYCYVQHDYLLFYLVVIIASIKAYSVFGFKFTAGV